MRYRDRAIETWKAYIPFTVHAPPSSSIKAAQGRCVEGMARSRVNAEFKSPDQRILALALLLHQYH